MLSVSSRHPVVTQLQTNPGMHVVSFQTTTNMAISVNRRPPTVTVLLTTVNENILDGHVMISIKISLRDIIQAVYRMIAAEIELRTSKSSRQMVMEVILVTVRTHAPSIGLKICIDGVLRKPRKKPQSPIVEQGTEIPLEMNGQITVKERSLAMG